jgi:YidC/Oxa1 family membrane protein insertase
MRISINKLAAYPLVLLVSVILIIGMTIPIDAFGANCEKEPVLGLTTTILPDEIDRLKQGQLQGIKVAEIARRVILPLNTMKTVEYGTELFGLASYYNMHWVLRLTGKASVIEADDIGFSTLLENDEWVGAVGRFNVLLLSAAGATPYHLPDGSLLLCYRENPSGPIKVYFGDKSNAEALMPSFKALRFSHLWRGLAYLSWIVTDALEAIGRVLGGAWGWAILIFGVILKILLLPINIVAGRLQRQVALHQASLEPKISLIKEHYDGEEAHNLIIASYKELGITPFFTLKPMVGALIQVPILIAIFNTLAEMPELHGASFFWIDDLAAPDVIGGLPFTIPFLGDTVNLLPLLMTFMTIVSTWIFKNSYLTPSGLKNQKRNLYLMGGAFLVLFYPFPAAMVLFWTVANLLQFIQQETVRF